MRTASGGHQRKFATWSKMGEIASATSEESHSIGQINVAVSSMDQAIQQNSALVEETSAATQVLSRQASTRAAIPAFSSRQWSATVGETCVRKFDSRRRQGIVRFRING